MFDAYSRFVANLAILQVCYLPSIHDIDHLIFLGKYDVWMSANISNEDDIDIVVDMRKSVLREQEVEYKM